MIKTKEQLIAEIAKLELQNQNYKDNDERRRKEFAKAFSWHKPQRPYSGDYDREREPILPTWEQIWVNLGTLLAARNFMDFEGNLSELEVKIEGIERSIKNPKQPPHDLG